MTFDQLPVEAAFRLQGEPTMYRKTSRTTAYNSWSMRSVKIFSHAKVLVVNS